MEEKTAMNPADLQTVHVLIDIVINSIEDVDSVSQSAYVDFNVSYIWKDPEVEGMILLIIIYFNVLTIIEVNYGIKLIGRNYGNHM